jgi:hypothetical protein
VDQIKTIQAVIIQAVAIQTQETAAKAMAAGSEIQEAMRKQLNKDGKTVVNQITVYPKAAMVFGVTCIKDYLL